MSNPILQLKNIKKVYPGVIALNNVSLDFYSGEVHAIVGENGAGKSTFIKTITGAIRQTSGKIVFNGSEIQDNNPIKSLDRGISAIYQEFNLIPSLSVAENIFYGRYKKKGLFVDFKTMEAESKKILDRLGISINPKELVKNLSVGYQQIVEIAKSLVKDVKVLIMDEPSAPLTNSELSYLFKIIEKLKNDGVAILYISHRLEEIFEICDKVSVFRDGQYIKTMHVKDTNEDELIRLMVNRELGNQYPVSNLVKGDVAFEVRNLNAKKLHNINFKVNQGEILGFAGLVGAGRTEVMRAIFGADPITSGELLLNGKPIVNKSPKQAIQNGIGLIPEDRKTQGALLHMSILENTTYANLKRFSNQCSFLNKKEEKRITNQYKDLLKIKTPSIEQKVKNLSGGNQQKVVLAKWLATECKILIFDEPTRGIDVGAKQEIYELMVKLAQQGKIIIMISSEMPELLGMSDRIIVMQDGKINGELLKKDATQEKILSMASNKAVHNPSESYACGTKVGGIS